MPKDPKPSPDFLYKYRSLANRAWVNEIILDGEIYYPKPDQINDPFDCKMPPIKSFSLWWARSRIAATNATTDSERVENYHKFEEARQRSNLELEALNKPLTADEEREFKKILSSEIKPKLEQTGVLSLSAVCDDILLWSHYADSHKGICLKFALDKWPDLKANVLPVDYPPERLLLELDNESLKKGQAVQAIVLTKAPSWTYEGEWRSLAPRSGKRRFPKTALLGIILGCQISSKDENWLKSILPAKHGIKLYRAEQKKKEFGLDIRDL